MKYQMNLVDAVNVIQEAIVRIHARNNGVMQLKNALVEFSTEIEAEAGGEISVFVVSVTANTGFASSNTISLTLEPTDSDQAIESLVTTPVDAFVAMADEIVRAVEHAASAGNPTVRLVHGESSVSLDLVVTEEGKLSVGTPSLFEKLLKMNARVEGGIRRVAKNSITLNFD